MAETDQTEIEEQLAVWEARGDGKTAQEEPRGPAKVIQLPLWPEPKRGAPNAVLRGALFAAVHKDRRYMDRELLAAQDGITRYWLYRGTARPGRPGRVGTGVTPGSDAGARHRVLFHRPRLSQGPGEIDRQDEPRMAPNGLRTADWRGGAYL